MQHLTISSQEDELDKCRDSNHNCAVSGALDRVAIKFRITFFQTHEQFLSSPVIRTSSLSHLAKLTLD